MKKIFMAILILLVSVLTIGCQKSAIGKIVKEGNRDMYLNEKYKFKIEIPTSWKDNYEFKESTEKKISDLKVFQIKFLDKNKDISDINTKVYVLDKKELQNKIKKEGKDIKKYLNENNLGEFLDEDEQFIFSIKKANYNEDEKLKYF